MRSHHPHVRVEREGHVVRVTLDNPVKLREAYGFGSMVMGMIPCDAQSGVFALLLASLERALHRRQEAAERVARIGIAP